MDKQAYVQLVFKDKEEHYAASHLHISRRRPHSAGYTCELLTATCDLQGLLNAHTEASFDSRHRSVQSNEQLRTPLTCFPQLNRIVYTQTVNC
jgi:hypothetical protein